MEAGVENRKVDKELYFFEKSQNNPMNLSIFYVPF